MIKLGVNSVLFAGFDFETAVKHIALSGYDGVEISAIKECAASGTGQMAERATG